MLLTAAAQSFEAKTPPLRSLHNVMPDDEWLPVSDWPLAQLGQIAEATDTPALLLFANRARPRWRQAVYLLLALGLAETPGAFIRRVGASAAEANSAEQLQMMARLLPRLSPIQIISGCFQGPPPSGLMSVLRKLDHEPLTPETYRLLVRWHEDQPGEYLRCHLMQKMVTLDQARIDAIEALDPVLMVPALLPFIHSKPEAERINEVLHVIRMLCSDADPETLRKSARELQGVTTIRSWVEGWLRRADRLPAPPFEGDDECRPLVTGPDLEIATRRFKNCLSNRYLAPILSGKIAVVEYVAGPALALMSRLSDGHWLLVSIHAPANRPVSDELSERVVRKVRSFGAHIHVLEKPDPKVVEVVQHVFGGFEPFDLEWQALEG